MRFDPVKFRQQRELLTFTQERLADASEVGLRTVQRAEAGLPISAEKMADLAATLGVNAATLMLEEPDDLGDAPNYSRVITLRRATSGRTVVDLLDSAGMCRIDCDIDPTPDNLPLLKEAIHFVETNMPDPIDYEKIVWPRRGSLVDRLELIAAINGILEKLSEHGFGMFIGKRVESAVVPFFDGEEGCFATRMIQDPEPIMAARVLLTRATGDRIVTDAKVGWPIEVMYEPQRKASETLATSFDDDLDDDVPF